MNEERWPYESLVALAAGELQGEARRALERQVAATPQMQREYATICAVLRSMDASEVEAPRREVVERAIALLRKQRREAVRERVREAVRHIAELVFDSRSPAALAGFRANGDVDDYHLTYASDIAEIDVQVKSVLPSGLRRIVAQVAPLSTALPSPTRARLLRKEDASLVQESDVDARGMFVMTAAQGEYDLIVDLDGQELVALGLRLE